MHFKRIKIWNTFFVLFVLYFLGYTHFLGGPFWLAKLFFVLILIGTIFFYLFIFVLLRFIKKVSNKREVAPLEKIKVDAKVIE